MLSLSIDNLCIIKILPFFSVAKSFQALAFKANRVIPNISEAKSVVLSLRTRQDICKGVQVYAQKNIQLSLFKRHYLG